MYNITEQRVCITFCSKIGENAKEIYELIKLVIADIALNYCITFD